MKIARLAAVHASRMAHEERDVPGLVRLLTSFVEAEEKEGAGLWSPTCFLGGRRLAEEAEAVSAFVLDFDHDPPAMFVTWAAWAGHARVVHTTWSHTHDAPRYRLVLPLAEPVPAIYWRRAWAWFVEEAARRGCAGFDPTSKALGRFYYLPSHPATPEGRAARRWEANADGELLRTPPLRELPEPLSAARGYCPGEAPPPVPAAVARLAVERWRLRLDAAEEAISALRRGRRLAIQQAAYHLGGWLWLGAYSGDSPAALARELHSSLWLAAVRCGRDTHDTERLLEDTLDAANNAPLPVDGLVPVTEHAALAGPEAAPDPLLVKYRSGHWIRLPEELGGAYVGPYDRAGILPVLREIGRLPTNARGKPEAYETILATSGVNAESVRVVYPRTHADSEPPGWTWTARRLAITRSVYTPPEPRRSDLAERYLAALAGPEEEALLDWLAASHRHEAPAPALYLDGPPGTGKTLLARALSAPWGRDPIELAAALGSFSSDVATCPIVLADEGYPLDVRGLAGFRSLVSERTHRLTEKYVPDLSLFGCVRVVIAANNPDALEIRDVKSVADLAALAERVMYLRVPDDSARGILEGYDGPDLLGEVAGHVEWLRATRPISPDGRWLVVSRRSAWHDSLLYRVPLHAAILGTILVGLARRGGARSVDDFAYDDAGNVRVRVSALSSRWVRDCPDEYRRPSLVALSSGLGAIGAPAGPGAWIVSGALLYAYGRSVGLTTVPVGPAPA
jgi:hypothetical protein